MASSCSIEWKACFPCTPTIALVCSICAILVSKSTKLWLALAAAGLEGPWKTGNFILIFDALFSPNWLRICQKSVPIQFHLKFPICQISGRGHSFANPIFDLFLLAGTIARWAPLIGAHLIGTRRPHPHCPAAERHKSSQANGLQCSLWADHRWFCFRPIKGCRGMRKL